jgi:hypothetical protein
VAQVPSGYGVLCRPPARYDPTALAACAAVCVSCVPRSDSGGHAVVNPIEVIKTRLQLQGELQEEKAKSGLSRIYGKGTAGPPTTQYP